MDGDDVIGAQHDVQFVTDGLGVIGLDGAEGQDGPVGQAEESSSTIHPAEPPERLAFEADGCPGPGEVIGLASVDVDPEQARLVDPDLFLGQVDFAILALGVEQDRANGQRTRARIPAVKTATSAIVHSTTRIE